MLSVLIALIIGTALGIIFGYGIFRILILYPVWKIRKIKLKFVVPVGSIIIAAVGLTLLTLLSGISGMKIEAWN